MGWEFMGTGDIKHRKQVRLRGYDYSKPGYYFVTVCVPDRASWFGKVENGIMVMNDLGAIVEQQWRWLPQRYAYVSLDEYCVMPNHFHGILCINDLTVGDGRDQNFRVGDGRDRPLLSKTKPLPELMGAFKTTTSKMIHDAGGDLFRWQRSYHDHIIRDDADLARIREYIGNNPVNWASDEENPDVIKG
jgi:putative transposase